MQNIEICIIMNVLCARLETWLQCLRFSPLGRSSVVALPFLFAQIQTAQLPVQPRWSPRAMLAYRLVFLVLYSKQSTQEYLGRHNAYCTFRVHTLYYAVVCTHSCVGPANVKILIFVCIKKAGTRLREASKGKH